MTTIYIVLPLLFLTLLIGLVYWEIRRKRMHTKARIRAWRERAVPAMTEVKKAVAQADESASESASETGIAPDKKRVFLLPARNLASSLKNEEEIGPDSRRSERRARA